MNTEVKQEQEAIRKRSYSKYLSLFAEAAELIKRDHTIRAYFPPTKSGIRELAAILHKSQKNTEKVIHGYKS